MALLTMNQEPETRFTDMFQFDQNMAERRDRFGGGTSLPLNSDGYEEKQTRLREERHQDWLRQQERPNDAVYYRVGPPEQGFPGLGSYEKQRREMNIVRQKEYNDLLKKQRLLEIQRVENLHKAAPRPTQPPGFQMDYNASSEKARAEEKRAYQDYMKAKEERYWQMRGRPVTPPGGLNIGNYDRQLKEQASQKKKEYKDMLDQQQREHLYIRARQEPEISVMDRNTQSQYPANKPPPGPGYRPRDEPLSGPGFRPRDEAFKTDSQPVAPKMEKIFNGPSSLPPFESEGPRLFEQPRTPRSRRSLKEEEKRYTPSKPEVEPFHQISPRRLKNTLYQDSEEVSVQRREANKTRQQEYNEYLQRKSEEQRRREETKQHQLVKPAEVVKNPHYSSDNYESYQRELQKKQGEEYKEYLSKKSLEKQHRDWNFDQDGILELRGDDAIQSKQRELRAERQKDYNNYISQHKVQVNRTWPEPDDKGALLVQKGEYEGVRQMYDEQRKKDFLESLKHRREMGLMLTPPSVTPEPIKARYPYFNPMIYSLGQYENIQKKLVEVRRKEFQDYLNQQQNWTPRNTVRENMMPHIASAETPIVSYMGKYDQEQVKFKMERNKDMHEYSEKKKQELRNPYSHYVYPTVAVAEKPVVEHMGHDIEKKKQDLREQRKHDYEQYIMQQRVVNPSRRHEFVDTSSGPYNGLFQGLGEHGNTTELLNQQRKQEYNDQLTQKGVPHGRPNWARDTLSNKSDVGLSSVRNPPPSDNYQQILEEKRREEANRRRFDDPEYQGRLVQADNTTTRYGY